MKTVRVKLYHSKRNRKLNHVINAAGLTWNHLIVQICCGFSFNQKTKLIRKAHRNLSKKKKESKNREKALKNLMWI